MLLPDWVVYESEYKESAYISSRIIHHGIVDRMLNVRNTRRMRTILKRYALPTGPKKSAFITMDKLAAVCVSSG